MNRHIDTLLIGKSLTKVQAKNACEAILNRSMPDDQITRLLVLLHTKKETQDEISGFLEAIRETTMPFPLSDEPLMDVCGTGGDGLQTFNVSTAVAFVLASLKLRVAKHGNRGVSSKSGSADVLKALRIRCDQTVEETLHSLEHYHLSFLFAQAFYPGLAKLASIRKSIDSPTLFNMLGPLLNPAPITHQLMGIYDQSLSANAIEALKNRGVKAAFVVHGSDGLDELTLSGGTHVTELRNGSVRSFTLSPNDFNLKTAQLSEVKGGTPEENATLIRKIFAGEKSAKRDLVVLNAAAAIVLSDKELSYKNAVNLVCEAIDSGKTLAFLDSLQINAGTAS